MAEITEHLVYDWELNGGEGGFHEKLPTRLSMRLGAEARRAILPGESYPTVPTLVIEVPRCIDDQARGRMRAAAHNLRGALGLTELDDPDPLGVYLRRRRHEDDPDPDKHHLCIALSDETASRLGAEHWRDADSPTWPLGVLILELAELIGRHYSFGLDGAIGTTAVRA